MSANVLFLADEQAVIRPSIDKLTETARMKRSHAFSTLRWMNTVLRAVSGNLRDGACFKLHKQTWRRKSNGTQKTISQNLRIKIL